MRTLTRQTKSEEFVKPRKKTFWSWFEKKDKTDHIAHAPRTLDLTQAIERTTEAEKALNVNVPTYFPPDE
jgi:hypothetical protein